MKPLPPVLIIAIDSETSRNPFESDNLTWSSPYNAVLDLATVIVMLYDPHDVYDVEKIREGFPKCNLTTTATKRFKNVPELKKITTLIYSLKEPSGKVERWAENIRTGYFDEAVNIVRKELDVTDLQKGEKLVTMIASDLMKRDITKDIVTLMDRVKYSMIIAQNLNFDYNTMVSKEVLDKNGWRQAFYVNTNLDAGGYLDSQSMPFGDFLGLGSFGLLYKPVNGYVKTSYLVDSFGFMTYALAKDGHFVRLPKLHPGNLDEENFFTHTDKLIAYNVRDVEIMLDIIAHFPEIPRLAIAQIETTYAIFKAMKGFSLTVNKEVFEARYKGVKDKSIEFTKKIRKRDPSYDFEEYLYRVFSGLD